MYTESDATKQAPMQALLRWFYTTRLELPYEAVPVCLQLLHMAGLADLADEANAIMNSEGTTQHAYSPAQAAVHYKPQ